MRKAKKRKATAKRAKRNPPGARVFSRDVHYVAYQHTDDGEPYKHKFAKGVTMAAASDGSIVLYRPDGKSVWGEF